MGELAIRPTSAAVPTVLYLDDDAGNRQAFTAAFRREVRILLASDPGEVWQHLATDTVHVLIADQRLPGLQGSEVLALVRERYPAVRRMIMTGYCDMQAMIDAINRGGVCQYLQKPWDPHQVLQAIQQGFAEYMNERERNDHIEKLSEANRQLEFALRQRLLS
jgi:DNA-binding NtrC family response regulator